MLKDEKFSYLVSGIFIAFCLLIGMIYMIAYVNLNVSSMSLNLEDFIVENSVIFGLSILTLSLLFLLKKRKKIPYI